MTSSISRVQSTQQFYYARVQSMKKLVLKCTKLNITLLRKSTSLRKLTRLFKLKLQPITCWLCVVCNFPPLWNGTISTCQNGLLKLVSQISVMLLSTIRLLEKISWMRTRTSFMTHSDAPSLITLSRLRLRSTKPRYLRLLSVSSMAGVLTTSASSLCTV